MNNPYMFPGVPQLTPVHAKRRSESHSSSSNPHTSSTTSTTPLIPSSSKKRPSTSGAPSNYAPSLAPSTIKVKHPYTVLKRGKKHHAFPTDIVPYPLNYDHRILDS